MFDVPTWVVTPDLEELYATARATGLGSEDPVLSTERMARALMHYKNKEAGKIMYMILTEANKKNIN